MIWAAMKHAVNSTLGTAQFKSIDKQIAEVYNVAPIRNGSAVKSIQRGIAYINKDLPYGATSIAIATINPAKSMVTLQGDAARWTGSSSALAAMPVVDALTANTLSVKRGFDDPGLAGATRMPTDFSWQIVEYY